MDNTYIYIVFSSTTNKVGKLVRRVTGEPYNHASIALDPELTRMYGFARRFYRTPLYGGFVRESLSRYRLNGQSAQICVCRLPVTREQFKALDDQLTGMFENKEHYLYNHLSALGAVFHRRVKAKDAYTCIEFCVQILSGLGVDVDPNKHYSVCAVKEMLKDFIVYTGPVGESEQDAVFYSKKPVPFSLWVTLRDMFKLLPRLGA